MGFLTDVTTEGAVLPIVGEVVQEWGTVDLQGLIAPPQRQDYT